VRIDFATRNGFRAGWSGLCQVPRHFSPEVAAPVESGPFLLEQRTTRHTAVARDLHVCSQTNAVDLVCVCEPDHGSKFRFFALLVPVLGARRRLTTRSWHADRDAIIIIRQ
jgi:hypothetical protein